MYGAPKIASWKAARQVVFGNDATLMPVFDTDVIVRAGLATVRGDPYPILTRFVLRRVASGIPGPVAT